MQTKQITINGQLVNVVVCAPSKRKAASSIQKPRPPMRDQRGARWAAEQACQFVRKNEVEK